MKKLKIEDLYVDSFATFAPATERGTVHGNMKPTDFCESVIRCSGNCPSAACSDPYC